jgi:ribosome recycling factor
MIKCENGVVSLKGTEVEMRADLSVIVRALVNDFTDGRNGKKEATEKIKESVRIGLLSEDEFREEFKKENEKLADDIRKAVDTILRELLG